MSFTPPKIAAAISLAMVVGFQPAHAQNQVKHTLDKSSPYDAPMSRADIEPRGYVLPTLAPVAILRTRQATTHNGLQVEKVLRPALKHMLLSGDWDWDDVDEVIDDIYTLSAQPGGLGAALEQLAGSQNANLAGATQNATQRLASQLLSTLRTLPADDDGHFWLQSLGSKGSLDKQGGSAGLKLDTRGLLAGADWAVDHAWRVGVMGAKTDSSLDAQRFKANLDSWHLGGYAVHRDGPLAVRLGAIYSSHAAQNKRSVNLLDYNVQHRGNYKARSQTLFSELGYELGSADFSLEPFVGLGVQRYQRDSFKEKGGIAALNVGSQTQQNLSSTLGVRMATVYRFDNQMSLTPHLSTSWKHLYGQVDSQVRQSYRYAPPGLIDSFTITGASLDRNSLDIQAGLDLALSEQHTVSLAYSTQGGTHSDNRGLVGQWQMSF